MWSVEEVQKAYKYFGHWFSMMIGVPWTSLINCNLSDVNVDLVSSSPYLSYCHDCRSSHLSKAVGDIFDDISTCSRISSLTSPYWFISGHNPPCYLVKYTETKNSVSMVQNFYGRPSTSFTISSIHHGSAGSHWHSDQSRIAPQRPTLELHTHVEKWCIISLGWEISVINPNGILTNFQLSIKSWNRPRPMKRTPWTALIYKARLNVLRPLRRDGLSFSRYSCSFCLTRDPSIRRHYHSNLPTHNTCVWLHNNRRYVITIGDLSIPWKGLSAGTAGLVVANRLTEDRKTTVLVLEAGVR